MIGNITTTITTFDRDLRVFYIPASSFPEGISDAHEKLHSLVPFSVGRRYFGLSRPENGVIAYKAAAEEMFPKESEMLNCNSLVLKKGDYIGAVLTDYQKRIHDIGEIFQRLLTHPRIDPEGYCLEWYVNDVEVQCLVKLSDAESPV